MTDVIVPIGGWGRSGWGDYAWSESGTQLSTASVGAVVVSAGANAYAVGVEAPASVGSVSVIAWPMCMQLAYPHLRQSLLLR
jgi:hypothetical protein